MLKNRYLLLSLAGAPFVAFCSPAQASLFADNFNVATATNDLNSPGAHDGQSGTLAPLTYTQSPAGASDQHQLNTTGPAAGVLRLSSGAGNPDGRESPDANFNQGISPQGMTISFDVNPVSGESSASAAAGSWASINFLTSSRDPFVNASNGIGILFRGNGGSEAFFGGGDVTVSDYAPGAAIDTTHHIDIVITDATNPGGNFVNGTDHALINAYADDSTTPFFTYTTPTGTTSNFISLGGDADNGALTVHYFDNLNVTPEPASLSLIALGAIGLLTRRRSL